MVTDPEHRSGLGGSFVEVLKNADPSLRAQIGGFAYQALACIDYERRGREEAERRSYDDPVAGCLSRTVFEKYADDFDPMRLEDASSKVCVVYVDVNGFKEINDTYGHDVGDELLRNTASCLKQQFRKGDSIFRMGGDEFLVVCPISSTGGNEDFDEQDQLLHQALKARNILLHEHGADFAIGTTMFDRGLDESIRDTVARADELMYQDKKATKQIEES